LLGRNDGWGPRGDDDIDIELNELGREFGKALASALRISVLDCNIATFDPTELAQPLHKGGDPLTFG
jgi:hypothetical protein